MFCFWCRAKTLLQTFWENVISLNSDITNKLEANVMLKFRIWCQICWGWTLPGSQTGWRVYPQPPLFSHEVKLFPHKWEIRCFVFRFSSQCNTALCTSYARSPCSKYVPTTGLFHVLSVLNYFIFYLWLIGCYEAMCIYNLFKQDVLQPARAYAKRFVTLYSVTGGYKRNRTCQVWQRPQKNVFK